MLCRVLLFIIILLNSHDAMRNNSNFLKFIAYSALETRPISFPCQKYAFVLPELFFRHVQQ